MPTISCHVGWHPLRTRNIEPAASTTYPCAIRGLWLSLVTVDICLWRASGRVSSPVPPIVILIVLSRGPAPQYTWSRPDGQKTPKCNDQQLTSDQDARAGVGLVVVRPDLQVMRPWREKEDAHTFLGPLGPHAHPQREKPQPGQSGIDESVAQDFVCGLCLTRRRNSRTGFSSLPPNFHDSFHFPRGLRALCAWR